MSEWEIKRAKRTQVIESGNHRERKRGSRAGQQVEEGSWKGKRN